MKKVCNMPETISLGPGAEQTEKRFTGAWGGCPRARTYAQTCLYVKGSTVCVLHVCMHILHVYAYTLLPQTHFYDRI